jgi:hypothetical protein
LYLLIVEGKKKEEFVEKIMKRVHVTYFQHSALVQAQHYMEYEWFEDPAPVHILYRECFNLVDLADRYWYKAAESHGNPKWKGKMAYAILKMFVINTWSIYCQHEYQEWLQYRRNLAFKLITFAE